MSAEARAIAAEAPSRSQRLGAGATVLLASLLLFLVEPMAAKQLLPLFGGSSAVWVTALVFFQSALLLGYAYARWLGTGGGAVKRWLHPVLLAVGAGVAISLQKPLALSAGAIAEHPAGSILLLLAISLGLPFALLASTSPLLQVSLGRRGGGVPYRLFALSNAGSFAALLLYPSVVEPWLSLRTQQRLWAGGFVVFALLSGWLVAALGEQGVAEEVPAREATARWTRWLLPLLLPAVGAMQLSAVTAHLTVNIAAIPLLWILPLGAYLLSFVLAFELPGLYRRGLVVRLLVVLLAALGYLLSKTDVSLPIRVAIGFFLLELFVACWFLHAELFRLRPADAAAAGSFYLAVAAGGAAGTCFVALLSPWLFRADYDLPLSFLATAVMAFLVTYEEGWAQRLLWITSSVLLLALIAALHVLYGRDTLLQARNFYGALRVKQTLQPPNGATVRALLHGSIQHGTEIFAQPGGGNSAGRLPTTYYSRESGIGLLLDGRGAGEGRRVGVVGLGAGTLAAYGRAGDSFDFYEINPLVPPIARNLFTFLRETPAMVRLFDGDARRSLERNAERYDFLAIDAFSGDAVPVHLLTTEAMELYRRHLAPGGVVAFHVSNQYVNLPPEIALLAAREGMQAVVIDNASVARSGAFAATWVLVASPGRLESLSTIAEQGHAAPVLPGLRVWSDQYSSLLPLLR